MRGGTEGSRLDPCIPPPPTHILPSSALPTGSNRSSPGPCRSPGARRRGGSRHDRTLHRPAATHPRSRDWPCPGRRRGDAVTGVDDRSVAEVHGWHRRGRSRRPVCFSRPCPLHAMRRSASGTGGNRSRTQCVSVLGSACVGLCGRRYEAEKTQPVIVFGRWGRPRSRGCPAREAKRGTEGHPSLRLRAGRPSGGLGEV
jgi:hypothetical protein